MSEKESFLVYKPFYEPIKNLSDEQLGRLFRSLFDYQIEKIECVDSDILMAFLFFKNQFVLDEKKYQKIVDRNRINGSKGGRPNNPVGLNKPKKADNEKDNDNDNEKEKDNISFEEFFDVYHNVTKLKKTDKSAALKKWKVLTEIEKVKALENISNYFNSLSDKKYCKKARTYLNDKNFNDEFENIPLNYDVKPKGKIRQ